VISTAIAASMLLVALSLADSAGDATNSAHIRTTVFVRAAKAADRLVKELQTASPIGEDDNENGTLDSGEDTNDNKRLDADWSLTDGGTGTSITFNKVESDWTWSGPIVYAIKDGNLVRTENSADEVICRNVDQFVLRRSGDQVVLSIRSFAADRKGRTWSESAERTCYVRN
jgi:hypothetical protein